MKIEVLYFKGCPNHKPAVEQVLRAARAEGFAAVVNEVEVCDTGMAQELGFLGSPSIRVNGMDVEASARALHAFGFGCRTYLDEGERSGLPPIEMIRQALAEAAGSESGPRSERA
jgi:hypothetical protein